MFFHSEFIFGHKNGPLQAKKLNFQGGQKLTAISDFAKFDLALALISVKIGEFQKSYLWFYANAQLLTTG